MGCRQRSAEGLHRSRGGLGAADRLTGVRVFQHHSDALTRSDADADHSVAHVAFPQLGGQREDVTAAGGTERMPDRDSAPVPGEFVVGDNESVELVGQ
jgi:hypothetical protein